MHKSIPIAAAAVALAGSFAAAGPRKESAFACDRSALTPAERRRHFDELGPALRALRTGVRELPDGYELSFAPTADTWSKLTEWVFQERRCCPFFDLDLGLEREGGSIWLRLTGRPGTKEFIQADAAKWLEDPGPATAPDFELPALAGGGTVHLAALRGKVVVLSFWAPWCAACKVEMPWLAEIDRRDRARGLAIVGVALDGTREEVARFAHERGAAYPMVLADDAVVAAYGAGRSLPETVVIGRDGRIRERAIGVHDRAGLEALVARALAGGR
jgi:peroxiredoxin